MAAFANWTATTAEIPTWGSARDKLGFATKFATYASLPGPEPRWQCEIFDHHAKLFATPGRTDEAEREALIHCGAALQHLKLALKRKNWLGRVDLFPDLEQPNFVARIHLGCCGGQHVLDHQLFDALSTKTNPIKSPLSGAAFTLLNQVAANDRSWLEFAQSEASQQRLQNLVHPSRRLQIDQLRLSGTTLTRTAPGNWESETATISNAPWRISKWRRPFFCVKLKPVRAANSNPVETNQLSVPSNIFAVLKTKTDDRHGWLAAGMILARTFLQSRVMNLECRFHLEPLQSPSLRAELRTAIGHKGYTQAILGFASPRTETAIPAAMVSRTETGTTV